jgi:protein-disulfide isomerase
MAARPDGVELVPPVGDRDRVHGSWDAPVTLVEFGDYDCPFTVRAFSVVRGLRRRLGGRLRFVFRVFPLTRIHAHAQAAAEAAEAAAAQGQFWEMHDRLFEAHRKLEDADLRHYAEEVGLDIERFEKEMEDHTHAARVREDLKSGLSSGVPGTPTFFINGVRHDGPNDFETLLAALEATPGEAARDPERRIPRYWRSS